VRRIRDASRRRIEETRFAIGGTHLIEVEAKAINSLLEEELKTVGQIDMSVRTFPSRAESCSRSLVSDRREYLVLFVRRRDPARAC